MKICRLKIDTQGRITFPKSFLDANNISRSVRLTFESRTERKSREEYLKIDSKS